MLKKRCCHRELEKREIIKLNFPLVFFNRYVPICSVSGKLLSRTKHKYNKFTDYFSQLTTWKNACTLVPSVFLRNKKTEFKHSVSFFVYLRQHKRDFECGKKFPLWVNENQTVFPCRRKMVGTVKVHPF